MTRFWFRKNHVAASPARVAEVTNVVVREQTFDSAEEATVNLLQALGQWRDFDSTGNVNGAIEHTLVNIDRLDDALDDLRDQVDKFKDQEMAEKIAGSGHPSTGSSSALFTNIRDELRSVLGSLPNKSDQESQVPLKASIGAPSDAPAGDQK